MGHPPDPVVACGCFCSVSLSSQKRRCAAMHAGANKGLQGLHRNEQTCPLFWEWEAECTCSLISAVNMHVPVTALQHSSTEQLSSAKPNWACKHACSLQWVPIT